MNATIEQTLERIGKLGSQAGLAKAGITTGSGLTFYDLESEAKLLYPVLAPIRQRMPRLGSKNAGQGLAAHWNQITNPNSTSTTAVVEEGKRGAQITPTVTPRVATYKGIGLEGIVTWESEYAAEGYDDVRAIAQRTALDSLILAEEPMLLWGNSGTSGVGLLFGTTPTPTGTPSTTGGTIAAGTTNYIYAVALSHQGWALASVQSPNAVVQSVVRTNADGTTTTVNGGSAQASAASSAITTTGTTSSIAAKVTAVKGAAGYAWFVGASSGAANAFFYALTTVNIVTITSIPGSGQTAALTATDFSANPLAFDGLITQSLAGNGYYNSLDGAAITHDGAGGIVEIDAAFKYFWDTYRVSPTRMYVGSQLIRDITRAITNGGASSTYQLRANVSAGGEVTGSLLVSAYTNKFAWGGAKPIPIELHPNMPDGHLFFDCEVNPYPTADIPNARAVRTRRDYFQVLWPIQSRNWQNGIYADQMLQVYVPFSMGLISNVGPGFN